MRSIRTVVEESTCDGRHWQRAYSAFLNEIKRQNLAISEDDKIIVKDYFFRGVALPNSFKFRDIVETCLEDAKAHFKS